MCHCMRFYEQCKHLKGFHSSKKGRKTVPYSPSRLCCDAESAGWPAVPAGRCWLLRTHGALAASRPGRWLLCSTTAYESLIPLVTADAASADDARRWLRCARLFFWAHNVIIIIILIYNNLGFGCELRCNDLILFCSVMVY